MKMIVRHHAHSRFVITALVALAIACGEDVSKDLGDSDSEAADSDSFNEDTPCGALETYLAECEISALGTAMFVDFCEGFEEIFVDSFMSGLVPCMFEISCEDFMDIFLFMESDAGAPDESAAACMEQALLAAEPEAANLEFQRHLCDYQIACDGDMTEADCLAQFEPAAEESLFFFMIIDAPYIDQANDCVDPMPTCAEAEAVQACIQDVGEAVAQRLERLVPGGL